MLRLISNAMNPFLPQLSSSCSHLKKCLIYPNLSRHSQFFHSSASINNKPKVVVLGSGWGSFKFLQEIDTKHYDVTVISPRNHFVLTPLLASVSVGTLGPRAIIEPVRSLGKGYTFYQANCVDINHKNHQITCQNAFDHSEPAFQIEYDRLIMSVGAKSNTFGIKNVGDYCHFLKEAQDALEIRHHLVKRKFSFLS